MALVAAGLVITNARSGTSLRAQTYASDPCLAHIIDREDPTWSPTVYFGGSHWHQGESMRDLSYGLPQAYPASKMASAGADWRTSAVTQLRWAKRYAEKRYGSTCAAWTAWRSKGWW